MLESILATKFVDIVSIHTNVSRSEFSQDEIEKLACNFLLSGGSTKPLIVRPKSTEEFDVIEGHLEFYAALRAKEIDDNFEMIQAIILDSNNEKAITEQVDLFKEINPPLVASSTDDKLIEIIKNLEEHLSSDIKNLKPQLSHQTELTNLENIIKSQFDALKNDLMGEKFTQEIANRVAKLIIITPPPPGKKTIEELIKNPIKLNTASKRDLLTVPGIGPQKALAILNRIEKKGNFQNINELAEIRGISKLNECFDIE
jgi:competence ComEA-like helix-hairpin-helix protein